MRTLRTAELVLLLCLALIFSGCAHMFRLDKGPVTPGCLLDAPYCAYQRQDDVWAGLGWATLAALSWPGFVFALAYQEQIDQCHARGGHWVCIGDNCNCVTVN